MENQQNEPGQTHRDLIRANGHDLPDARIHFRPNPPGGNAITKHDRNQRARVQQSPGGRHFDGMAGLW